MKWSTGLLMAMVLLVLGNLFATLTDVLVKALGNDGAIFQYLWLRQVATIILVLPFLWKQAPEQRYPGALKIHILRAHLGIIGASCTLIALLNMPLATANVIFYAAPLLTVLVAFVWLKEKIRRNRVINALIGFVGVGIALRPDQLHWAALVAFVVALSITGFNLLVVKLPKSTSVASVMLWTNVCALPVTTLLVVFTWKSIGVQQLQELLLLGVCSAITVGVYQGCVVMAFRQADASAAVIAEYSGLLFSVLFGYWLFNESLDIYTAIGILLIMMPIALQGWQGKRVYTVAR
ncbi:MAG: DMT family transporter [Colwellia sp.]|nr:DMT family transporter [Colwellia sp.]MCW8864221.1 DMT family transporter [Colwellia sp.]MCW9082561.1 DMT family transporter [Colwellia sp.]